MNRKTIYYLCIVIGLIIALYANAREDQNVYILIGGIVLLMIGLYNIARGISPKKEASSFIETERDNEESD